MDIEIKRDYWPTEEWKTCSPKNLDMDDKALSNADGFIRRSFPQMNSCIVIKNGYIVFENYYNSFNKNCINPVMSVTKSVLSALAGIAIDKGLIESVDQRIIEYFPELSIDSTNFIASEVTIEHLLSMTSGFQWRTASRGREFMLDRMCRSKNWVEFMVNLPVRSNMFGKFQYNSGNSHLLSAIITRATGMNAQDFANKYLFCELGIPNIEDKADLELKGRGIDSVFYKMDNDQWVKDPQGNNFGGLGLSMRTRDMAKVGYLYLNWGYWDNKSIISQKWIYESIKKYSSENYGYHWWIKRHQGYESYYAMGYGGQRIIVIPELDLVVVFTCDINNIKNPDIIVDEYVIPSIIYSI